MGLLLTINAGLPCILRHCLYVIRIIMSVHHILFLAPHILYACLTVCWTVPWLYPVTWGSLRGNIHRHSWPTLSHVDSSDAHRVSSVGAQVMERVCVDSVEQIRVLCSVGLHTVEGELQTQKYTMKDSSMDKTYNAVKFISCMTVTVLV